MHIKIHHFLFPFHNTFAHEILSVGGMQAPPGDVRANNGMGLHTPRESPNLSKQRTMTNEEKKAIADLITANVIGCTKEVLTSDEAAVYMGVSKSYLYKLTMRKQIPHYKPMGKMCYFNRAELEEWLQQNRCATDAELSQKAAGYCQRKGAAV